jgi:periplasmic divalent cation tolerance protein
MFDNKLIFIYVTAPSKEIAQQIAKTLLEEKWVACVNVVPSVESFYWWEGKVQSSSEVMMIIKTVDQNWEKVRDKIVSLHPYDCPAVVKIESQDAFRDFQKWIENVVS